MVEQSKSLAWTKCVFADISSSVMPPAGEFDELNELAAYLKLKVVRVINQLVHSATQCGNESAHLDVCL